MTRATAGARAAPALLGLLGLAVFALVFEVAPRLGVVPADYAPPTSRVLAAAGEQVGRPAFWAALADTLLTWGTGLGIAVVAGVGAGVLIGAVPFLRAATATTVEFLRPIPSVALIPLVIVLYGSTIRSTVVLVVYAAFWQVLVQVLYGVADLDPVARDTARSYRLGRRLQLRYLLWPTALPYVLTGIRLAAAVALILAVTGELVIGSPGLGKEIDLAQQGGAVPAVYALILVTGLLGVLANVGLRVLERHVLAWHPSSRREVTPS
ncbi:ABC transporter permease [Jidongwangia harbinensis]|uniref:ABC transporter permease n=1 Tax=Jidongwangia harbinensis TaxID=2878561 RepID=UPI001CD9A45E|nr:ABC transporter permease subunit [Jidongwangia harbinensis]MCA2217407.1 ABC transporter permease subunit [Jidongwangia harbinensis]